MGVPASGAADPLSMALAIASGVAPQYGLYTAIIPPIIAALFGSSRHLISGPTTAISIVIFSSIKHHSVPCSPEFVTLALTMTFLAGVYQLAFGLAKLGALVNFVSHTVVMGFTAGAAILIATSQMKHILGIEIPKGESFLHTWYDIYVGMGDINPYLVVVALVTLLVPVSAILLGTVILGEDLALRHYAGMVLIAAEMLAQNPGLGKFVWDEFQNGSSNSLGRIMVAVIAIGLIGFILDRGMLMLQRRVSWDKSVALR